MSVTASSCRIRLLQNITSFASPSSNFQNQRLLLFTFFNICPKACCIFSFYHHSLAVSSTLNFVSGVSHARPISQVIQKHFNPIFILYRKCFTKKRFNIEVFYLCNSTKGIHNRQSKFRLSISTFMVPCIIIHKTE
jgi:hypothetical protein